jgi:hypothetical protein
MALPGGLALKLNLKKIKYKGLEWILEGQYRVHWLGFLYILNNEYSSS